MPRYRYLLGDSRRESARLRHQAGIWDPTARALFDRLKVKRRWRVLEIGPGQGSLHMELRRRIRGPVDAVEPSSAFADEPPEWDNFLEADGAFFESQGGDVNIGARLPLLYERAGLHVTDVTSTTKVGRPGSAEWKWLTTYFLGVLSRYADFRPFTPKQAASLRRHWLACAKCRTSLLISPTVLDVVGVKRR